MNHTEFLLLIAVICIWGSTVCIYLERIREAVEADPPKKEE